MLSPGIVIRTIEPQDNAALACIVRNALKEFGANKPGTVYFDPTTDALYELFQQERSVYFVALSGDTLLGGGGIYPTPGLPPDTCELVKMYLSPKARRKGLGKALIRKCIDEARQLGYRKMYLETMPELQSALGVYEKMGFHYLTAPMGNSGHFGCDLWMMKDLMAD